MLSIISSNIIKISMKYYRCSIYIITLDNRLNFTITTVINTTNTITLLLDCIYIIVLLYYNMIYIHSLICNNKLININTNKYYIPYTSFTIFSSFRVLSGSNEPHLG